MLPGRLLRPRLFVTIVPPQRPLVPLGWLGRAGSGRWLPDGPSRPTAAAGRGPPDQTAGPADHLERDWEMHALVLDLFRGVPRPAGPSRSQMLQALIR